jgi:hypothetical protein
MSLRMLKKIGDLSMSALVIKTVPKIKDVVRKKLELDELIKQILISVGTTETELSDAIQYFSSMPDVQLTTEEIEEIKQQVRSTFVPSSEEDMIKFAYLENMGGQNDIRLLNRNNESEE